MSEIVTFFMPIFFGHFLIMIILIYFGIHGLKKNIYFSNFTIPQIAVLVFYIAFFFFKPNQYNILSYDEGKRYDINT